MNGKLDCQLVIEMIGRTWNLQLAKYASQPDGPLKGAGGYIYIYIYIFIYIYIYKMLRNVVRCVFVCSRTQCSRTQCVRGTQCSRTRVRTVFGHTITRFGGPIPCGSSTHAGLDTLGSPGSPDAMGSPSSPGHPGTRVVAGLWHGLATGHGSMPAVPLLKHSLRSTRDALF